MASVINGPTHGLSADQTTIASTIKTRVGTWISAKITITSRLYNTHEFFGNIELPQLTQILPAVQLSGTSNVTAVYGSAVHLEIRLSECV